MTSCKVVYFLYLFLIRRKKPLRYQFFRNAVFHIRTVEYCCLESEQDVSNEYVQNENSPCFHWSMCFFNFERLPLLDLCQFQPKRIQSQPSPRLLSSNVHFRRPYASVNESACLSCLGKGQLNLVLHFCIKDMV